MLEKKELIKLLNDIKYLKLQKLEQYPLKSIKEKEKTRNQIELLYELLNLLK